MEEKALEIIIDLSTTFTDVYGDTVTYSALSSNTALIGAAVCDTTLTLEYQENQNSIAPITVTAIDAKGAAVTDEFSLTVNPVNNQPLASGMACSSPPASPEPSPWTTATRRPPKPASPALTATPTTSLTAS